MARFVTFGATPLRFSPPGNQRLEMAREAAIHADGIESNVAVAARALGCETVWVSKLPDTPLGRRVVTQVAQRGVETAVTWDDGDCRQGLTFQESGAWPRESRRVQDRSDTPVATMQPAALPMETVRSAPVVFTGLSTPVLSEQAATTTAALLRASAGSDAVTAVGLDYTPGLAPPETYRGALADLSGELEVFVADEADARAALDRSGGPRELANTIAADHDLTVVVITTTDGGAVALHETPGTNVVHERAALETDVVDPAGQQGAFVGAFLQQLIDGTDTAEALSHAVAAAALARTVPGPFLTTDGDELAALARRVTGRSE